MADPNPSDLKAIRDRVAATGTPGLYDEAHAVYVAANEIAGEDWFDLYEAHFAACHPHAPPIEEGVLQAGDRIMLLGAEGGRLGPATVAEIRLRPLHGDRVKREVDYLLETPEPLHGGGERIGGCTSAEGVVHARDWPAALVQRAPRIREVRPGKADLPDWFAPPGR